MFILLPSPPHADGPDQDSSFLVGGPLAWPHAGQEALCTYTSWYALAWGGGGW